MPFLQFFGGVCGVHCVRTYFPLPCMSVCFSKKKKKKKKKRVDNYPTLLKRVYYV